MLNDFRSVHLVYCLDRQPNGRWVALNREYKPLGFGCMNHVDYADYPIAFRFRRLTPKLQAELDHTGEVSDRIYLYDDGCTPTSSHKNWDVYVKRLELLAKLQIAD